MPARTHEGDPRPRRPCAARNAAIVLILFGLLVAPGAHAAAESVPAAEAVARPRQACADLVADSWSEPEGWSWIEICEGRDADLAIHAPSDLGPESADRWPEGRNLSGAFLRAILMEDRYRQATPARGVRIFGARFTEAIDLVNEDIAREFWLMDSAFEAEVSLDGTRVRGRLLLSGSRFTKPLDLTGIQVDRSLFMRDGASFTEVVLSDARIGGELSLRKSRVSARLDLARARITGNLIVEGAELGEVTMHSARVMGDLMMTGSKFTGKLTLEGLRLDSDAFMKNARFAEVTMLGARIMSDLEMTGSEFTGELTLEDLRLGSDAFMKDASFAKVNFVSAEIGGYLMLSGSTATGNLDLTSTRIGEYLQLDDAVVCGLLDLERVQVGADIQMYASHDAGLAEFGNVYMVAANVAGDVSLGGARVHGWLNMEDLRVGSDLFLNNGARFEGEVGLPRVHIGGNLHLSDSTFARDAEAPGWQADCPAGEPPGEGPVGLNLLGAVIDGDILLDGTEITGHLGAQDLKVGSDLLMRAGGRFASVDLSGANIGGILDLSDSVFTCGAEVPGWQADCPSGESPGEGPIGVDLLGAVIDGDAFLEGTEIKGHLRAQDLKVGSDLLMRAGGRFASVDLSGAEVGSYLMLDSSQFAGLLDMERIRIGKRLSIADGKGGSGTDADSAIFADRVILTGAAIAGDAFIVNSSFGGEVDLRSVNVDGSLTLAWDAEFEQPIRLRFAQIGSNLDLTAGLFESVDLTGTTVGAEIRLASKGEKAHWREKDPDEESEPESADMVKLTLRNVKAGALQDLPKIEEDLKAWPESVDLEGFTYGRLGGFLLGEDPRAPTLQDGGAQAAPGDPSPEDAIARDRGQEDIADRDVGMFIAWLQKHTHYSPQPYTQLATVLKESGHPDKAKRILFEGKMEELKRDIENWSLFGALWLGLELAFTGFGLYPWFAAFWVIGLVILGTWIFSRDRVIRERRYTLAECVFYSVGMLVPIVILRRDHTEFDLTSRAKYYLYAHKLMGYVLATFLIAAATGAKL